MPELPEVEVTKRHLAFAMEAKKMSAVRVTHHRTARYNSGPEELEARLVGRAVDQMSRTGKFLHARLDDGQTLVAHLGMSGRFAVNGPVAPHTHFTTHLDDGTTVSFIDPRTFGFVAVHDDESLAVSSVGRLGPDAWDSPPTVAEMMSVLHRRSAPIKALLLDQLIIAGLGNIYADEVLHLAGIHPMRAGGSLTPDEVVSLLDSVHQVLSAAIENGGTSLDDLAYLLPDGRAGDNLHTLGVYGRLGLPCRRCGDPVQRIIVRARSTHYCAVCQN